MSYRILVIGDTHVGSDAGLLGPSYWREELKEQESIFWGWYLEELREYGPFTHVIGVGDALDGEGKKDSINTILPNTLEQARAAEEIYLAPEVDSSNIFLVRGTPFHSTGTYNYEDPLADALGASIADEHYLDFNGLKIKVRHTAGRSDTAYGQGTPVFRDSVKDLIESATTDTEPADLILEGHVHYHCRMTVGHRTVITNPCLQLPGTVFGRKCRSTYYHVGFGVLDIKNKYDWNYIPVIMPLKSIQKKEYTKV